jgi:hypothetical protein
MGLESRTTNESSKVLYIGNAVNAELPGGLIQRKFIYLGIKKESSKSFVILFDPEMQKNEMPEITHVIPLDLFLTVNDDFKYYIFQELISITEQVGPNCDATATINCMKHLKSLCALKQEHFPGILDTEKGFEDEINKILNFDVIDRRHNRLFRRILRKIGCHWFSVNRQLTKHNFLLNHGIKSKPSIRLEELKTHLDNHFPAIIAANVWELGTSNHRKIVYDDSSSCSTIKRIPAHDLDKKGSGHAVLAIAYLDVERNDKIMILDSATGDYHFWDLEKLRGAEGFFHLISI